MSDLTVVCEQCDNRIDGIIDATTHTVRGVTEPVLMTGGYQLTDNGAVCDDCYYGEDHE